jgi:hypothetical protein
MVERECTHWRSTAERGKHYDCMICLNSDKEVGHCLWLPYKALNEESNSSAYKLLLSKVEQSEKGRVFTRLELSDLEIPNEGKVMEVKEKSILSGDTESSHESFLKKFEYKKLSEVKVEGEIKNIKFISDKINLVALSNGSEKVMLFDYNFAKKKEEELDYTVPVLNLTSKKPGQMQYGLDWSPHESSTLMACSMDYINIWDLKFAT